MAIKGNGSSGWVSGPLGIQASAFGSYTLMIWMRCATSVASPGLIWGGGAFIHSALFSTTTPDGYFSDEVDNSLTDVTTTISQTHSSTWTPLLFSKQSQTAGTLWVGPTPTSQAFSGTLGTQTLTNVYIGQEEAGGGTNYLATSDSVAEAAIWAGALGLGEINELFSGANALSVQGSNLLCYFPMRTDLVDYGPAGLSLSGVLPTFTDHPPVATFP